MNGMEPLEDFAPANEDRRVDERYTTLFQVARILTEQGEQHLCLIRNIGSGGMMLEVYAPLEPDTRVRIEPKLCDPLCGVVRWSQDRQAGIAFDSPIDVPSYLSVHNVRSPDHMPRGPRIVLDSRSRVRIGSIWHLVPLRDLSQGGAKIETDLPVEIGEAVEIDIEGVGIKHARVRWVRGERVGMTFSRPLRVAQVARWIAANQPGVRAERAA
ncbi:PilZ domain-containing protein [Sphingomonas suaedae]|uniref:PilZ domain-containing protein n=2 Tax=Sphingomonas suaedae TaxID=2599297 RepID=A0A518RIK0_9SPHN|nr:PilZ domain-containing protein [Sphingomonas suaedae]